MKDTKLYKKAIALLTKPKPRPVEDIHRSLDVVEHIMKDARDLKIDTEVVTWALKCMKENPALNISAAIILGYEEWHQ
jgi:hypothetical protein